VSLLVGLSDRLLAGEQAPPEAVEDLVDVFCHLLIFSIASIPRGQVDQIAIHSLAHTGAGFGWISLWV